MACSSLSRSSCVRVYLIKQSANLWWPSVDLEYNYLNISMRQEYIWIDLQILQIHVPIHSRYMYYLSTFVFTDTVSPCVFNCWPIPHNILVAQKPLCFDIVLKRKGHTTANRIVTTLKYIYRTMSTCRNFWDKQVSTYIQKSTYCHFGGIQKSTSYCLGGTGIQRSWEIYKSPPIAILELYRSLTIIVNFWVLWTNFYLLWLSFAINPR